MAQLIAKHLNPIPSTILELFQAIIKARTTVHDAFQQSTRDMPDPEIKKSNVAHKFFIDALKRAFEALGSMDWKSNLAPTTAKDTADVVLHNTFAALSLGHAQEGEGRLGRRR